MRQMLQQETITRLALQCSQRLKRQRTAKLFFQCTVLVFERCWDFSILDENRGVFEKDRPEDEMMSWAGNELFAARQDSILEQMGAPWVKRQLLIRFTIRCVELWTFAFLFKDKAINICCPGTGTSIKTHLAVSPGSSRLWVTGSKLAEVVFWNCHPRCVDNWQYTLDDFCYRGSVLKLIYHNLIIFVVLYFFLSILYRFVLIQSEKERQVRSPLPWIDINTFFTKVLLT